MEIITLLVLLICLLCHDISGGATSIGVGTKNESSHILHNYNFPLGYAVNYKKSESHISGLSLTDGVMSELGFLGFLGLLKNV